MLCIMFLLVPHEVLALKLSIKKSKMAAAANPGNSITAVRQACQHFLAFALKLAKLIWAQVAPNSSPFASKQTDLNSKFTVRSCYFYVKCE